MLLKLLEFLNLVGDSEDPDFLAYWRLKDVKMGGQVIDHFCHELHEYVVNVCCKSFPSEMASQMIQTMLAATEGWYLNHLKPGQMRGKLACMHTFICHGLTPLQT